MSGRDPGLNAKSDLERTSDIHVSAESRFRNSWIWNTSEMI